MTADDIEKLAKDLGSPANSRRQNAADALMQLGAAAYPAAAALVGACRYEDVRTTCVETLENLGPPTADQLPQLAELVGAKQLEVSYWAATLLGRAGDDAAQFAVQLEKAAMDSDHPLASRERAVWALGKIGPGAVGSAPSLRWLSASPPSPRLGRLAEESLRSIGV